MKPTWLDRAIGWVSPTRGVHRAQARQLMELAYEGAKSGRRTSGWVTTGTSADAEIRVARASLRDRANDLVRNNPYAARAVDVKVANTIGTGILAELPKGKLADAWNAFQENACVDGLHDLAGLQTLTERCRFVSGETLLWWLPTKLIKGSIAMRLRVLEPDHLDQTRDGVNAETGNLVLGGIEYDRLGDRVAYWIFPQHPGDSWSAFATLGSSGMKSVRVSARDVIPVFRALRPGQSNGVSEFAPVMMRLRDLDDYDDAEIMRKKIEACFAGFITPAAGSEVNEVGAVSRDAKGRVETLSPGTLKRMQLGETVTFADPKASGGYADFQRFGLRAIASGLGIPYELMTGDLSQVNYSSYRAGLVDFRRRIEQDQWQLYVPRVCQPIWRRFLEEYVGTYGAIEAEKAIDIEWTPPRFELIDPLKETQGEILAVQSGLEAFDETVRRRGWSYSEQLDKIERWQKELTRRGIVITSDARVNAGPTTQRGASAPAEPAPPPLDPDDEGKETE